nr:uncharacterized protein LOC111990789 [Quercus suber]
MGGFTVASSPSPEASEDENDEGSSSDDANEDDGDGSPINQAISSIESRFKQFQSYGCICRKKFFKIKINKILFKIYYIIRKMK